MITNINTVGEGHEKPLDTMMSYLKDQVEYLKVLLLLHGQGLVHVTAVGHPGLYLRTHLYRLKIVDHTSSVEIQGFFGRGRGGGGWRQPIKRHLSYPPATPLHT